jgi:putative transposase
MKVGVFMVEQRRKYPTDLTEAQWRLVESVVPPASPQGYNRRYSLREILNGISYVLRTGCAWRHVPHDLPHWEAVYSYFRLWRRDGTWQRINDLLHFESRTRLEFALSSQFQGAPAPAVKKGRAGLAPRSRKRIGSAPDVEMRMKPPE